MPQAKHHKLTNLKQERFPLIVLNCEAVLHQQVPVVPSAVAIEHFCTLQPQQDKCKQAHNTYIYNAACKPWDTDSSQLETAGKSGSHQH